MKKLSLEKLIEKYAVKNALEHGGKSNPKSVLGKIISENHGLKNQLRSIIEKTNQICEKINKMNEEEQKETYNSFLYKQKKVKKKVLKDLPEAEYGKVVMRLAPFPSGPLHIGNARTAILNDEYVKKYNGRFILVIDDTIGSKEKMPIKEAYNLIIDGLKWLGVKIDEIVYKSDRMKLFYKYAELFLKNGWAYVCTCPAEKLRENRKKGIECEHRNQTPEKNLKAWKKMLSGEYKEGEAAVRLKTNMEDKDPAFRDRVLLRISEFDHPRVGKKYRVWPMLEFSWAIDDHELGITHILRGKDLAMEAKMEKFMWNLLGWKAPIILNNGMMRIEGAKISKSKAQKEVKSKIYRGWDDPRTWSLQSLRKRGFDPKSIRKFVLDIGLTKTDIKVPIENLYRENRVLIEPKANRYFFVPDPVKIEVSEVPHNITAKIARHPDFKERGFREIELKQKNGFSEIYIPKKDLKNKHIRLKNLFDIELTGKKAKFLPYKDKNVQIVQWLPLDCLECQVFMPDGDIVNGFCEKNILELEKDSIVQFERFGFCKITEINRKITAYYAHS